MASEIRNRFTDTEMQIARETDLPELLSHLGYQVKRVGRFHTTTEMDSLRIKDRRKWFRYSQNTGGDAITFLQQFCGKSFPEAVEYLLTFHGKARDAPIPQPKPISPKQEFSLPPRNADDRRVFAYLRKRGIAAQVIRQFLKAGLLYEDAVHHNCVFVGRDDLRLLRRTGAGAGRQALPGDRSHQQLPQQGAEQRCLEGSSAGLQKIFCPYPKGDDEQGRV